MSNLRTYKCVLSSTVSETIEVSEGVLQETNDRGWFAAVAEIELPFVPRRGFEICFGDRSTSIQDYFLPDTHITFKIRSVAWSVERNLFILTGDVDFVAGHENTAESLEETYRPWKFRYITDDDFEADGRIKQKQKDDE